MVKGELLPILAHVEGLKLGRPLDPDLVFLGNVNPFVARLVLIVFRVVAPDVLSAELNSGLLGGGPDESDQRLNIDNSSEVREPVSFEMGEIVFGS